MRIRIRIWHKLAAILLVLTLPLALTAYFLLREQNIRINATWHEIYGIEYLQPLSTLFHRIPQHQNAVRRELTGTPGPQEDIPTLEATIEADFAQLSRVDQRLRDALHTSTAELTSQGKGNLTPAALVSHWEQIKAVRADPDPAEVKLDKSNSLHVALISDLRSLITHVGDTSLLLLDPDLDTYYTMDALLIRTPQVIDQLYQLGNTGEAALAQKNIGLSDRNTLTSSQAILKIENDKLADGLNKAFQSTKTLSNNVELAPTLQPLLRRSVETVENVLEVTEKIVGSATTTLSPGVYAAEVSAAVLATAELWNAILRQEGKMLGVRQGDDLNRRWLTLTIIGASLAVVVLLTLAIARSIAGRVGRVARTAGALAAGDLNQRVGVRGRDEVGALARSFNTMADRLRSSHESIEDTVRQRTALLELVQHVATAANEANDSQEATQVTLDLLCHHTGWPVGHAFLVLESNGAPVTRLVSSTIWHLDDAESFGSFRTATEALVLKSGEGLAGSVHASGKPIWAVQDDQFHPALNLEKFGLHTAMAFPVLVAREVAAVLEFFTPERVPPDEELLAVVENLGTQLGRVAERSRARNAMEASKEEAELATRSKSVFLATMSHELRTPMNAVIGMTELLLTTELTPEQNEFAKVIYTSGENLLGIINDILDFSKIEAGKLDLEKQPFNLRECIEDTLTISTPAADKKGLSIAYVLDPGVPEALAGDVIRLRQVLLNLFGNAVKFTERGGIVLTVTAEPPAVSEDNSRKIHFRVQDTGIGIPANQLEKLFESFSQADDSTTRRYGGTGLGLAISKRLVELMGGTIGVESTQGQGSTFHFTVVMHEIPAVSGALANLPTTHLRSKRLLAVDNDPTNLRILTLQGKSWGMLVTTAEDPQQALEWVRRGDPFDIVALDMQMPGTSGLHLGREIHRHRPELPLVLLTSTGQQTPDEDARAEFAGHLSKPIKQSELHDLLSTILTRDTEGLSPAVATHPTVDILLRDTEGFQPLRILLAEDNQVNQTLAVRMLAKLGYQPDIVDNGAQAVEAIQKRQYDLVFMDIQMPEMDGLEASRHIRQTRPPHLQPHIVALTANAMEGDREACLAAGMDDYLSKPLSLKAVADSLRNVHPVADAGEGMHVTRPSP